MVSSVFVASLYVGTSKLEDLSREIRHRGLFRYGLVIKTGHWGNHPVLKRLDMARAWADGEFMPCHGARDGKLVRRDQRAMLKTSDSRTW